MENKIEKSVVAQGGSTIKNVANNESNLSIKKAKRESLIIGFIIGVISSIVATYIYERFF